MSAPMQRWSRVRVLAASLSLAVVLAAGISAQAIAGGNGAAVVRFGDVCLVGDQAGGSWWVSCRVQHVFGPTGTITSITGSVIREGSSPLPSTAVTDFAGWPCLVLGGQTITTATSGVLTPSGQVQLTCKS